jgi:hypothetical protein
MDTTIFPWFLSSPCLIRSLQEECPSGKKHSRDAAARQCLPRQSSLAMLRLRPTLDRAPWVLQSMKSSVMQEKVFSGFLLKSRCTLRVAEWAEKICFPRLYWTIILYSSVALDGSIAKEVLPALFWPVLGPSGAIPFLSYVGRDTFHQKRARVLGDEDGPAVQCNSRSWRVA